MDADLTDFSAAQQQALCELLILAIYADGHLPTAADEPLPKLLATMGHTEEIARQREVEATVARLRPLAQFISSAKDRAITLANAFTARSQQKQMYAAVQPIMTWDKHRRTWENTLLTGLRLKFRM
jgi:hypothetical protein